MTARRAVAVTGASGFLGRTLCAALARRGWEVRALVREPAVFSEPVVARVARCDLPDVLDESALSGADAVVHCAYATRETDLARARRVNEEGTRRLLDASRRLGVPRFVFISTVAAYDGAPSYYARSKLELERLLDLRRDTVIRPGLILGRGGHGLFQQLLDNMQRLHLVPLFGGGRQPLQTVHIDDVCEAVARAIESDLSGAFNVAEADPAPFGAFLRSMARRLGVRVAFVPLPFGPVLAGLRVVERLRVPFPLRAESILGLRGMRAVATADDLARLGMTVRTAEESLGSLFPTTSS
jgi:nucleoside-diphosphate-sugar epimerase